MSKALILVLGMMVLLTGCGNHKSNIDSQAILDNASKLTIKSAMVSLGKEYDVSVNGQQVAEVDGKVFNGFGDVFTLKDENGNVLGQEQEVKRWGFNIKRSAIIKDAHGNTVGYIGEQILDKIFSYGYVFHFYDKNKNEIGKSNQVFFSLFKENKYSNSDGREAYQVNANFNLLTSSYDLTIKDKSKISLNDAIFMVCIEDAIYQADKKDSKSSKKS